MSPGPRRSAPALEYERLLIALQALLCEGKGDLDEADALRDRMDVAWHALEEGERAMLDDLSGDLDMLDGSEVFIPLEAADGSKDTVERALQRAWKQKDWLKTLQLLRKLPGIAPPERIAYVRAQCWSELGFDRAALAFLDHAAELAPHTPTYAALALDTLHTLGEHAEASRRAERLLDTDTLSPLQKLKTVHAVHRSTQPLSKEEARPTLERIATTIEGLLEKHPDLHEQPGMRSTVLCAVVEMGLCHAELGNERAALEAYGKALSIDAESDAALTARGLLTYKTNQESAARDFEEATRLGTPFPWPYVFLAHRYLKRGRYQDCLRMCDRAIIRLENRMDLANVFEWSAIVLVHLGAPDDIVYAQFEAALACAPLNQRIRRNLEIFEAWVLARTAERSPPPPLQVEQDTPIDEVRQRTFRKVA